ncbi:MAG: AAA family ATPase [Lachnospiraceae bacterium]|nr:AAA family ATPase [Lachnospiraceae bacterium]
MGMFLNSVVPYEAYKEVFLDVYFVDKTLLIEELVPAIGRKNRYFCITRPRRFGKSVMADMVSAFFCKSTDGRSLFSKLLVGKSMDCMEHLNCHNVIFIDFSRIPRDCNSYGQYIARIQDGINNDFAKVYKELEIDIKAAVWDNLLYIFQNTGDKFIFVIDEWDAVFHMPFVSEAQQKEYLLFLKNLLKDQVYAELVYMTGVLPVAKYSSGSELNMFLEYDMATSERFSKYFGFSDTEVDTLYEIYRKNIKETRITREELCIWYDGYHTAAGENVYNPRSIVCALTDNQIRNYWTSSGPYDEIFYYIKNNVEAVRDDLVLMAAGEGVGTEIQNYTAVSMKLDTKDEIYSAMVIYGLLAYKDGKVFIPNREIMEQFRKLLMSKETLGYVYRLARESEKMLKATLSGDIQTMAAILKFAHDTESPIFSYNSEIELSAVVNLVYLAARDRYRVEREDKAGEGYVDFIFYPERKGADAIILELKVNCTPEDAIKQIKSKNYVLRFKGKLGENPKYTGRILAVGISYSKKTKEHLCKVEVIS